MPTASPSGNRARKPSPERLQSAANSLDVARFSRSDLLEGILVRSAAFRAVVKSQWGEATVHTRSDRKPRGKLPVPGCPPPSISPSASALLLPFSIPESFTDSRCPSARVSSRPQAAQAASKRVHVTFGSGQIQSHLCHALFDCTKIFCNKIMSLKSMPAF